MGKAGILPIGYPPLLCTELSRLSGIAGVGYTLKPAWPHFQVPITEAAGHKTGQFAHLQTACRQHYAQFGWFDKFMVVMQTRRQAATGKMLAVPDECDARKYCAVDRIEDKNASWREDAGDLIDCRGQIAHMFKHIQTNND